MNLSTLARGVVLGGGALALASSAFASPPPASPARRTTAEGIAAVAASRFQGAIVLDGKLDEGAWAAAEALGRLRQRNPDEGRDATERTEVWLAYDDFALYVGARMHDHDAAAGAIVRQLSRRDAESNSDTLTIYLDPQHDHRTGVMLQVSAAGSLADALIYDDNRQDDAWDGVWDAAVAADRDGWTAELRMPFSQLRFAPGARQTWGLNVRRYIQRKNEDAWWELVPKTESRLASGMGHLEGLDGVPARRHLDLMPYVRGGVDRAGTLAPGDPLRDPTRVLGGMGLDAKWGVTSNVTVDATVNPDFGQVEVDPAVVNLTAFETFFEEKRPFFIEGAQLFGNFGRNGLLLYGRFGARYPTLYYSRRVGRTPQLGADGEFVDAPAATTILGAAKVTARSAGGWNLSVLDALTGREFAQTATGGARDESEVEPLTNYIAARASRDFGRRGSLGFVGTSVVRNLRTTSAEALLPGSATVAGADGHVFLDTKRTWVVSGSVAGSRVDAESDAITRLKRSSARYFQRPDAGHPERLAPSTSLAGWTGQVNVNRRAGALLLDGALWAISPGFEANDLGYSPHADRAGGHLGLIWRKTNPDRFSRSRDLTVLKWWVGNFDGDKQVDATQVSVAAEFRNYWNAQLSGYYAWRSQDDRLTRGGPSAERLPFTEGSAFLTTDQRRVLSATMYGAYGRNTGGAWSSAASVSLRWRPSSALTLEGGPEVSRGHTLLQYVRAVADPLATTTFGRRYVFADIDQTEVSMPLRLNWIFTPRASFQLYAQPLISVGDYWGFKELARPRAFDYRRYGLDASTLTHDAAAGVYAVDPDGPGAAAPFAFDDPDFNFRSVRANAVFRWEWRLGSTLYVAWTQRREDDQPTGVFDLGGDLRSLGRAPSDNTLMVKVAYWFSR